MKITIVTGPSSIFEFETEELPERLLEMGRRIVAGENVPGWQLQHLGDLISRVDGPRVQAL